MLLPLSTADLMDTRLVISPWWETLLAVRALASNATMHRPWSDGVRRQLATHPEAREHWAWLRAFIPTRPGFMADSLTPTPRTNTTMAQARAAVLARPHGAWLQDLDTLRRSTEEPEGRRLLDQFELDIDAGVERLCDAVQWFHDLALQPHWERIRAVHVADIDYRTKQLGSGGLERVLSELHPLIRRVADGLEVSGKSCTTDGIRVKPGLTLIPCAFAWPGVQVVYVDTQVVTVTYVPRGIAALWEGAHTGGGETATPLSELLGCTRANILRALDVPMTTTQLAAQLCMAAATISAHLKVLSSSSLLDSSRAGREVFYARTSLGAQLAQV